MNHCCLVGQVARDPQVRFEGEGQQTTSFLVLVEEPGLDGALWRLYVPCVAWGKAAEHCAALGTEALVALQGRLCWRKQTEKQGHDNSTLCVNVREVQRWHPAEVPV
jgi:single-stranded DNA-binding protein